MNNEDNQQNLLLQQEENIDYDDIELAYEESQDSQTQQLQNQMQQQMGEEEIDSSVEENLKAELDNKEEVIEIDRVYLQQLVMNEEKFFAKVQEMNDDASIKLQSGKQKEALQLLLKAEKILEFGAQCGKSIDRNLIIVVLYNRACAYQSLWILDKCSKYVDGVIYNLEISLQEEEQKYKLNKQNNVNELNATQNSNIQTQKEQEKYYVSHRAKKQTFLAKSYLQYCAILSQLGLHQQALETARETIKVLQRIFKECYEFCQQSQIDTNIYLEMQQLQQQVSQNIGSVNSAYLQCQTGQQQNQNNQLNNLNFNNVSSQNNQQSQKKPSSSSSLKKKHHYNSEWKKPKTSNNNNNGNNSQNNSLSSTSQTQIYNQNQSMQSNGMNSMLKEQVLFSKQVVDYAIVILRDLNKVQDLEEGKASKEVQQHFEQAKKSLYFWKNNPENNERHIRQELNVPLKQGPQDNRSLLGVANDSDWIENFNIGTIMHMNAVTYQDFTYFGDILYEVSKRNILEKVIYLSICYFTIATEIRFLEIDKCKGNKIQDQEGFKRSEIYHLKSIEIVCKHIISKSPYINHLITSYHKHYNQNLDIIQEEQSFYSTQDFSENKQKQQNNNQNNGVVQTQLQNFMSQEIQQQQEEENQNQELTESQKQFREIQEKQAQNFKKNKYQQQNFYIQNQQQQQQQMKLISQQVQQQQQNNQQKPKLQLQEDSNEFQSYNQNNNENKDEQIELNEAISYEGSSNDNLSSENQVSQKQLNFEEENNLNKNKQQLNNNYVNLPQNVNMKKPVKQNQNKKVKKQVQTQQHSNTNIFGNIIINSNNQQNPQFIMNYQQQQQQNQQQQQLKQQFPQEKSKKLLPKKDGSKQQSSKISPQSSRSRNSKNNLNNVNKQYQTNNFSNVIAKTPKNKSQTPKTKHQLQQNLKDKDGIKKDSKQNFFQSQQNQNQKLKFQDFPWRKSSENNVISSATSQRYQNNNNFLDLQNNQCYTERYSTNPNLDIDQQQSQTSKKKPMQEFRKEEKSQQQYDLFSQLQNEKNKVKKLNQKKDNNNKKQQNISNSSKISKNQQNQIAVSPSAKIQQHNQKQITQQMIIFNNQELSLNTIQSNGKIIGQNNKPYPIKKETIKQLLKQNLSQNIKCVPKLNFSNLSTQFLQNGPLSATNSKKSKNLKFQNNNSVNHENRLVQQQQRFQTQITQGDEEFSGHNLNDQLFLDDDNDIKQPFTSKSSNNTNIRFYSPRDSQKKPEKQNSNFQGNSNTFRKN